ncbi:microtubule-associated protein YTM1 [Patellaria atrata CBS 101060]|uniref:Ribosome biogenesis protein YTM1 n=1 Tax=Patellaria atrata CBS 101060 TaxID=1346257 RepID=A0A9P4VT54_9PEZI|nr:microtubule-associated protein YTM1 [Patellaria atrata CBS 101060]
MSGDLEQPGPAQEQTSKIRIQFITRDTDHELPAEASAPILVATKFRRYALSTLINTLLDTPTPVPFEFLILGQFLRTSIEDFLTANGISAETTLTVEYVRALIPPLHVASFEHDSWVSAIDVLSGSSPASIWTNNSPGVPSGQEKILSGSDDGLLRIWNMSSEVEAISSVSHNNHITNAKFLSPTRVVSASFDRTIRLWKYESMPDFGPTSTLTPSVELYGHKASVDSIAVHAPSSRLLSASQDHTVGIWSSKKTDAPPAPQSLLPSSSNKRRKLNPNPNSVSQRGSLALMTGHTASVTSVSFAPNDPTVAYSSSLDHTLRTWDLATRTLVDTRTTAHALSCLTPLQDLGLVATGTDARSIILIDPRASATAVSALTLRGHTGTVWALSTDPSSAYGLASGALDSTVRIWDVRAARPGSGGIGAPEVECVYTIERESGRGRKKPVRGDEVKVFGIVWDGEVGVVSAGSDKRVQVNRSPQGVRDS